MLGFVVFCLAVGFAAVQLTATVRTTLYVPMAVAAWRVWRKAGWRSNAMARWLAQLVLSF